MDHQLLLRIARLLDELRRLGVPEDVLQGVVDWLQRIKVGP